MKTTLTVLLLIPVLASPSLAAPKQRQAAAAREGVQPAAPAAPAARPGLNLPFDPLHLNEKTGGSDASSGSDDKVIQNLSGPFKKLADFLGGDAEGAITLSTSVPGLQDGHGQQCWIAARDFTAVFKAHPLPLTGRAMTDLEALRLLAIASKKLCDDAHCTQVFTDFKNMAITVAQAGFGALGATAVRAAPSLSDVCTQIPNIPVVAPVTVPPAPSTSSP